MAEFSSHINDIGSLSSLLTESRLAQENSSAPYNQPPVAVGRTSVVKGNAKVNSDPGKPNNEKQVGDKDIWKPEEILSEDQIVDWKDERPVPRYEFSYKQSVGTEDTFLGTGEKTPLTSDCTHLVVKIHFPKSTMKDLDLNVTKNRIKAASRTHHLFTYLPVNVDADNGKAKFDSVREVLSVTLPIVPDY